MPEAGHAAWCWLAGRPTVQPVSTEKQKFEDLESMIGGWFHQDWPMYGETLEERWQHLAFQFVQHAFNEFLISDYSTSPGVFKSRRYQRDKMLADNFSGLTVKRAAQIFGRPDNHAGRPFVGRTVNDGFGQESMLC